LATTITAWTTTLVTAVTKRWAWLAWQQTFTLRPLASQFTRTANSFAFLAATFLGRFLKKVPAFHFPEEAFALHLFLQCAQGLINIIVTDDDLNDCSSP
jgi:hypothetical protein